MKRYPAVALATLLVVTSFALAGCAKWFEDPAKPANAAIAVANGHLKKAAATESEVTSSAVTLEDVAYTRRGARAALKTTKALKTLLAEQKTELMAGKAAMDGIAKLEVSDELKQYAKLESLAIDTRMTIVDTQTRLYDALERLYTAVEKRGAKTDPQDLMTAIAQIRREIVSLTEQAAEETKAAADYFTKNGLGG